MSDFGALVLDQFSVCSRLLASFKCLSARCVPPRPKWSTFFNFCDQIGSVSKCSPEIQPRFRSFDKFDFHAACWPTKAVFVGGSKFRMVVKVD